MENRSMLHLATHLHRARPTPWRTGAIITTAVLLTACGNDIWNAGDLAEWVRDRAVEEGCARESIELDEWYTAEAGGNVWHGRCRDESTGAARDFGINVDSVWTPSSES